MYIDTTYFGLFGSLGLSLRFVDSGCMVSGLASTSGFRKILGLGFLVLGTEIRGQGSPRNRLWTVVSLALRKVK